MSAIDRDRLQDALAKAWFEWVADTGCLPDGFHIAGPPTTRVHADWAKAGAFIEQVAAWYERSAAPLDDPRVEREPRGETR